jgi:hypothetical protein
VAGQRLHSGLHSEVFLGGAGCSFSPMRVQTGVPRPLRQLSISNVEKFL